MRNVVRIIFAVSDLIAWILLFASLAGAVMYPFAGPIHARMDHHALSVERIVLTVFFAIIVAVGAYLLTRRKILGLPLVLVPCIGWGLTGSMPIALCYGALVLIIFVTPLVLSYIEMKRVRESEHT